MPSCRAGFRRVGEIFSRRKSVVEEIQGYQLRRVLTLTDLIMLGIGSTVGLGAYVLTGEQARKTAGPAILISLVFAAVASGLGGICYAEFAARVPKAGSAYVYSYVTVGELVAFVIGWDLIMEYSIGAASLSRGLTGYIDGLADNAMSKAMMKVMPMHVSFLAKYPDFLAFFVLVVGSALLAWGVKESSTFNKFMTVLNLTTIAVVIIVGSIYIDFDNWSRRKDEVPQDEGLKDGTREKHDAGEGGFMPFGWSGVMTAAAKLFYAFVGFDCIATTGEEAKNPKRDIPVAIVTCLAIILVVYFLLASVLTLAIPYYNLDINTPIPSMFDHLKMPVVKYIVFVGIISALCTNIVGCLFPMPRILYAMALDRLLFSPFAKIHSYTRTPTVAIAFGGMISAVMALMFDTEQLVDMMSIGTLLAYSLVAICVLMIRYQVPSEEPSPQTEAELHVATEGEEAEPEVKPRRKARCRPCGNLLNLEHSKSPTRTTESVVSWVFGIYVVLAVVLAVLLANMEQHLSAWWGLLAVGLILAALAVGVMVLWLQPKAKEKIRFKVPLVPLVPCVSLLLNFYLMAKLDFHTWIRFFVWLFVGGLIYGLYGIRHSAQGHKLRLRAQEENTAPTVDQ